MLDVFTHPDLPHQLVLVPVHPRQLAHMGKDVLDAVSELRAENKDKIISKDLPSVWP